MSFINWGGESPEQRAMRERYEAEQALFEQAVRASRSNAAQTAGGVGGGSARPFASIDWLVVAPNGSGSEEHDYENFDEWTTDVFEPVTDVTRLSISGQHSNAHVHGDYASSDLTIELYDADTDEWITVWSYTLVNPNVGENNDSDDFYMNQVSVTFPAIAQVTRIRVSSDPGSNQTYHGWGISSTLFNFYR